MKKILISALTFSALISSACATVENEVPRFQQMSCNELSQEIGRWEAKREAARIDAVAGAIGSGFGKDKATREEAEIEEAVADIELSQAKDYLAKLNEIRAAKRCTR